MPPRLSPAQVFCYLRLGLVTGLIDKAALIAWADAEIMAAALPDDRIIDLALSQNLSYSAILWRLRDYQGPPVYDLALEALLARAGRCLAADPDRAADLALGLRLLDEEEYLPPMIRRPIQDLKAAIDDWRRGHLAPAGLHAHLAAFLAPFRAYEALLDHLP